MTIEVRVPATSANLGPGFDVLGLALGLYNEILYEEADRVAVSVEGEGAEGLDTGADNVVSRGARMVYEAAGRRFHGATIRCINRIPLARGLGSSAARSSPMRCRLKTASTRETVEGRSARASRVELCASGTSTTQVTSAGTGKDTATTR